MKKENIVEAQRVLKEYDEIESTLIQLKSAAAVHVRYSGANPLEHSLTLYPEEDAEGEHKIARAFVDSLCGYFGKRLRELEGQIERL